MANKNSIFYILLILALISVFCLDLILGNVSIPLSVFWDVITGNYVSNDSVYKLIVFEMRLPKAIAAMLIGSGLSISGLLIQSLFRNPLAGPFTLGISSGASLGVAFFVLTGAFSSSILGIALGMSFSAIFGAFAALVIVLSISSKHADNVTMLIIGIMLGSLITAIVSILQFFSQADALQNFVLWTMGSLSGITWLQLSVMSPIIMVSLFFSMLLVKPLNAILLGNNYAQAMGVNVKRFRLFLILISGTLAGVITAFAGPIAFIGIAVPHLARNLFNTTNHRILIASVILIGALVMLICDVISQLPFFVSPLPINSITSLFGAPIVLWVVLRNKSRKGANG